MWVRRILREKDPEGAPNPGEEATLRLQHRAFGVAPSPENTISTSGQVRPDVTTYSDKCGWDLDPPPSGAVRAHSQGRLENVMPSLILGSTHCPGRGPVPARGQTHLA